MDSSFSSLMQSAYSRDHHLQENAYNRLLYAALLMTDLVETHVAPYFNALYQLERDERGAGILYTIISTYGTSVFWHIINN